MTGRRDTLAALLVAVALVTAGCRTTADRAGVDGPGAHGSRTTGTFASTSSSASPDASASPTDVASATTTAAATASASPTSGASYPAAGAYRYGQTGYERFCQALCDRRDLPSPLTITVSHASPGAGAITVIDHGQVSEMRATRNTSVWRRSAVSLVGHLTRFATGAISYESSWEPQPPIQILRLPIRAGQTWFGSWEAETAGEYTVVVVGVDSVSVGGKPVPAYRVETEMTLSGEFEGSHQITLWIDPATKATVRARGSLDVRASGGRYETHYDLSLDSAPGY